MLTEKQKNLLMVFALIFVLGVGGNYYYQMMYGDARKRNYRSEVEELETKMREVNNRIKEYNDLQNQKGDIEAMREKVELARKRLPRAPNQVQFHEILTAMAKEASVYLIKVEPLPIVRRQNYIEIPYRLECFAKYHSLGEFFNLIEENKDRLMRIKQFRVTNESGTLKDRPSVQYAVVEISAFAFRPRKEPL